MTNVNDIKDNVIEPLTSAVLHVLLALADSPQHGYAVMRSAAQTAISEPSMGPSTIYGSLNRMVDAGLVSATRASGRKSKRYALTPAGHRALWAEAARICRLADLVRKRRLVDD
ncbi:MAG: PadR family transcriptional regulator [Gemmatimonadales bacterium]